MDSEHIDVGAGVSKALEEAASGRDGHGRFASGNLAALRHGQRSRQVAAAALAEQAELRAALAEKRRAIHADLGDRLNTIGEDLIDRYLELDVMASWLGDNVMKHGMLTGKGRTRAAVFSLLAVTNQQVRLAEKLGIERRERAVSPSEYVNG
jgi:hypothetical protein